MVNYTIEEAMYEQAAAVTDRVRRLQNKLDTIGNGIKVVGFKPDRIAVPRQVSLPSRPL